VITVSSSNSIIILSVGRAASLISTSPAVDVMATEPAVRVITRSPTTAASAVNIVVSPESITPSVPVPVTVISSGAVGEPGQVIVAPSSPANT